MRGACVEYMRLEEGKKTPPPPLLPEMIPGQRTVEIMRSIYLTIMSKRSVMTGILTPRGTGCLNYAYSLEKPKPVPKGKKGKVKMPVKALEIPPPLCDFVEWIDKEMD